MKQQLIAIETELDDKANNLSIWKTPFQNILSQMLLMADSIERQKGSETAFDYCSRLSYIFGLIKNKAATASVNSTTNAILSLDWNHAPDIKYLAAYAHFSMLMPQVHRDVIVPISIEKNVINLDFKDSETEFAETIDRIYSYISLQVTIKFSKEETLDKFLSSKVASRDSVLAPVDFVFIKSIQKYFYKTGFNVEILPSDVIDSTLGLTFDEYLLFISTAKAFAYYFHRLSNAYYNESFKLRKSGDLNSADNLMNEYFEFCVPCLDFKSVGFYMQISGLSKTKMLKALSFFLSIYSNTTGDQFEENSFCGEGFFPPFILLEDYLVSSPLSVIGMLSLNCMLYSVNKKRRERFDEQISSHLEPTLINQLTYIFTKINGIRIVPNVNYAHGEIDLLILSEKDNVCLALQVKATIAPDSSRTVERVETRALEGIEQIKKFRSMGDADKINLVKATFGVSISNVSFLDILVVRSCAGSAEIWNKNKDIPIANYSLLASIISDKLKSGNDSVLEFDKCIWYKQEELLTKSKHKKVYNDLEIGDYTIRFPNIEIDMSKLTALNMRSYIQLPELDKSHSN